MARGELQHVAARLSPPLLRARAAHAQGQVDGLGRVLKSLNPFTVLERGYARITAADGRTLVDRAAAAREPALTVHFRDGALGVIPAGSAPVRAASKPKLALAADPAAQGKLL